MKNFKFSSQNEFYREVEPGEFWEIRFKRGNSRITGYEADEKSEKVKAEIEFETDKQIVEVIDLRSDGAMVKNITPITRNGKRFEHTVGSKRFVEYSHFHKRVDKEDYV